MIRDLESWRMPPNIGDFATFGRMSSINGLSIGTGAFGDPAVIDSGYGNYRLRRVLPGGPFTTLIHSYRVSVPSGAIENVAAWDSVNGVPQVIVSLNGSSGVITISNGSTTLLTTAPGQFPLNAAFWLSIKFVIGTGASGAVGIYIGPSLKVNLTGVNTAPSGREYCDTTGYYITNYATVTRQHMIWNDTTGSYNNGYMSDQRVVGQLPSAAGADTQSTPVGNSAPYLNAASYPPAPGSDYNLMASSGLIDLYKVPAISGVTAVAGIMVSAITSKTDSGARNAETKLWSYSSIFSGASTPCASTPTTQSDITEVAPSTSMPFTAAALARIQAGVSCSA